MCKKLGTDNNLVFFYPVPKSVSVIHKERFLLHTCITLNILITVNKLNLIQRSSEDLPRSGSDSGMESWRHRQGSGNNNSSTVPVGLTMMSPETPPDPRLVADRWSDDDYTDSEPETERKGNQHTSPLEVCIFDTVLYHLCVYMLGQLAKIVQRTIVVFLI